MKIVHEISKADIVCRLAKFPKENHAFHWHDKYEICKVVSGGCRFRVDGCLFDAKVGDVIVIDEHIIHQFLICEDNTEIIILQFPQKMLVSFCDTARSIRVHIKKEDIDATDFLGERIDALLSMMIDEKSAVVMQENQFLQSLASALYLLLMRHFATNGEERNSKMRDRRDFYTIIEYLNAHYKDGIGLENISRALYFTKERIASLLKKYAGISASEYINTLRVKDANLLLLSGKSVTEAAYESGFQSIRTFNNAYRKIMNITPSEYTRKKQS